VTTTTSSTFKLAYTVETSIRATPAAIWARLTDAAGFPAWNSTVTRIGGEIALGQRLAIEVPIAPGRTFTPSVTGWSPGERMVWTDGFYPMFRGMRTFTLTPDGDATRFTMSERFAGLMVPLSRGSLPDFAPVFDQYAADLKRVCEGG
jgi:hypothetical protein